MPPHMNIISPHPKFLISPLTRPFPPSTLARFSFPPQSRSAVNTVLTSSLVLGTYFLSRLIPTPDVPTFPVLQMPLSQFPPNMWLHSTPYYRDLTRSAFPFAYAPYLPVLHMPSLPPRRRDALMSVHVPVSSPSATAMIRPKSSYLHKDGTFLKQSRKSIEFHK